MARIGTHILYQSEIDDIMPEGISAEDSIAMVREYINSWALNELMLRKAKSQLSNSDKNINKEIEDFKKNILTFRYEKLYIEERLDTLVTEKEIKDYYEEHKKHFTVESSIIKGRIVRISSNSPYYEMIQDAFSRAGATPSVDAKESFLSFTEKFVDFGDKWADIVSTSKEIGVEPNTFEKQIVVGSSYEMDIDGMHYLVYINDYVKAGAITPIDYNSDKIRQTIISKRKQDLVTTLKNEVLSEATTTNQLKIYNK